MKTLLAAIAAFSGVQHGTALTLSASSQSTPTQKVINMMTELKAKGQAMLEEERKLFSTYAEWADDESKRLGFEIKDGESAIERLVSTISKAESDAKELKGQVADLDAEIDKLSAEKKESAALRAEQHKEYERVSQDYSESVDALSRAIAQLSAQNYDRDQAEGLIQLTAAKVPGLDSALAELQEMKAGDMGAPEVAAYKFQSGGILQLLKNLSEKFKAQLSEVEEAETNQAHEFELVQLHLSDGIAEDKSDRNEKVQRLQRHRAASAKAQGELAETRRNKAADEKLKQEVETTFAVKKAQFEENQKVRKDELVAIDKALEIISSPEVAGSYSKRVNLVQRSVSLLQVGSAKRAAKDDAVALLQARAKSLNSRTLSMLASELTTTGPFSKIIDMIDSLITRLKEEAAAEADHKAWCDKELKANKQKRTKKAAEAEDLNAQIDGLAARIVSMGEQIAKLSEEQVELTKAMKEATEMRGKEKAENLATIEDAQAGAEAVKRAIVVLKEFYSGQASFLQGGQVPEMAAYKGMKGSSTGILGMLEVIASDFLRLNSETQASEKVAAKEYSNFMATSEASKTAKHEEEVKLTRDKDQAEFEKVEAEKDLKAVEAELGKANDYFEQLKPACLQVHVSWEERAAKRKEEIASLKEAYDILDKKSKE